MGGDAREGHAGTHDGGGSSQEEAGAVADTLVVVGGEPPRTGRVEERGTSRGCSSAAYPGTEGPQTPSPTCTQLLAENLPRQPHLVKDFFQLQHGQPGLKRRRSPRNYERIEPKIRSGLYGIGNGRERGKRPRIGFS